jgi:hypothetical protein
MWQPAAAAVSLFCIYIQWLRLTTEIQWKVLRHQRRCVIMQNCDEVYVCTAHSHGMA